MKKIWVERSTLKGRFISDLRTESPVEAAEYIDNGLRMGCVLYGSVGVARFTDSEASAVSAQLRQLCT